MSQDYNKTVNLPQTEFPMRGNLPQREPEFLKKWYEMDLYKALMEKNADKPMYVLHDGPPYANGNMHMGHALDNVLKDIVIRYKSMTGYQAPYIPGWDTHGLPIEQQAIKKLGINRHEAGPVKFRKACEEFARSCVDTQREQRKRLGGIGDWDHPYLTLLPEFEGKQIEIFGEMAKKGYIYKGLKPVYWCPECETALAEAEIEYADVPCDSIFVKFKVHDDKGLLAPLGVDKEKTSFVIWTTTTWTLPGNLAICLNADFEYSVVKTGEEYLIMATELVDSVMSAAGIAEYEKVASLWGNQLEFCSADHPFMDRTSLVILGEHVTLDAGTGCVHTAPGFGVDDFLICQKYPQVGMTVPVDAKGYQTAEAGKFAGLKYDASNKVILEDLKQTGALLAVQHMTHSYPHCWRCKNPIIFRATEQWFASVGDFKEKAIEEARKVQWVPAWGEERICKMIEDRNDWCISRQRMWGVPIPIFYCKECGKELITEESIQAVADLFSKEGSNAWYTHEAEEILPAGTKCPVCGHDHFRKEQDIMDVWFDSGSSHAAVLKTRENAQWPADMYSEGNDQYRGWFQSSLLTSVAAYGKAPYKTVLTHGMVVDGEGRKMSKSLGNGVDPLDIVKKNGADILRLWVVSSDYKADIRFSQEILKQISETYRKIRNTARFILGNLTEFDPNRDMVAYDDLMEIDRWALGKLNELIAKVRKGYETYEYHTVYQAVHNFCVVDMSSFYLDIIKDRLYIEKAGSAPRLSAQSAMYRILHALTRLLAPALAFTADEIWQYLPHLESDDARNVVLNDMPQVEPAYTDEELAAKWERILVLREDVKKALEIERAAKRIRASLEASVTLYCDGELYEFVSSIQKDLPTIFIVSQVHLVQGSGEGFQGESNEGLTVKVEPAAGAKCERCWVYSDTVGQDSEHPTLCARCAAILKDN
ncbi:MAG: isoleucine--tRNA ligase [Eubacteriales bacterium]|jgi:isoleucyl-tRNA synthetase